MNILIIGGTVFLGKHIVKSALKKNHNVTIFNRGLSNPDIFPDIEKLKGDRSGNFDSLKGRTFDAVIDTCGYVPSIVKMSAEFLKNNVDHYTFISSISVYKEFTGKVINEESEVDKLEDESVEEVTIQTYGPLKALCEKAVQDIYKDKSLIIRSGLIVGEDDPTDRFTYWIHRINEGGKVIVPDTKTSRLQFIDVKDISEWIIKMIENRKNGVYNIAGPDYVLTLEEFINKCIKVTGGENNTEIEWVDVGFLLGENVIAYVDMPIWRPDGYNALNEIEFKKALIDELKIRPLEETLKDTLKFDKSRSNYTLNAGLKPEREKELLEKWFKIKNR